MISRRLIRIKVLQIFYAYIQKSGKELPQAEKELEVSLHRTLYLYYSLLLLVFDIVDYAYSRIEIARAKKIPTHEDLHPNLRFVENRAIKRLREDPVLQKAIVNSGVSWVEHKNLVKKIYQQLMVSTEYQQYMEDKNSSFSGDAKIVQFLFTDILAKSGDLESALEEQSIYWNDELEFVLSILYRFLDYIDKNKQKTLPEPELFRNNDDKKYAFGLLHKSILHREEYLSWIEEKAKNWDVERIALVDILILVQGITEIIHFTDIPVRVSINEYIDIAKYYSTPKSSVFVNGILDRIVADLREKNGIKKIGRGLIGEKEDR